MMAGMFSMAAPLSGVAETYDKPAMGASPPVRWALARSLAHWKALLVVARHVYRCEYTDEHAGIAADVLLQWVRLAAAPGLSFFNAGRAGASAAVGRQGRDSGAAHWSLQRAAARAHPCCCGRWGARRRARVWVGVGWGELTRSTDTVTAANEATLEGLPAASGQITERRVCAMRALHGLIYKVFTEQVWLRDVSSFACARRRRPPSPIPRCRRCM